MSLAASRTDAGADLISVMQAARSAADTLLNDATVKIRERVAVNGRIDARAVEREQRATHGLAWFATYAEAIRQLTSYAERMSRDGARVEAEIGRPHQLALAHQDAARHLRQEFAGADAHQQLLDLAEAALLAHPLRIGGKLADRLDIGREPGEPVGRSLLAIEEPLDEMVLDHHALAHGRGCLGKQFLRRARCLARQRDQLHASIAALGFAQSRLRAARRRAAAPLGEGPARPAT